MKLVEAVGNTPLIDSRRRSQRSASFPDHLQAVGEPRQLPASQHTPPAHERAPEQSSKHCVPEHVIGCLQESGY